MAITSAQLASVAESDGNVVSTRGQKIGGIGQVYIDDVTGEPTWVTATMGLFGRSESFVPVRDARISGKDVVVSYDKETVKEAPRVDADDNITPEEEQTLYTYYGLASGGGDDTADADLGSGTATDDPDDATTPAAGGGADRGGEGSADHDISGPTADRIEREPNTDANLADATSGPDISEEEHEVVLQEEQPVVEKATGPVERVRLETEAVPVEAMGSADARKERIDTDVADDAPAVTDHS